MKKYAVIYGSATGTTADVARRIATALGQDNTDVLDVKDIAPADMANYDTLVLGTSTWGDGEVEDDWFDMLDGLEGMSLKDKKIALFGCGDENMADTFCNGVGYIYDRLQNTGATFIAPMIAPYDFNHSTAVRGGVGLGLLLDETNHPDLTDQRITDWVEMVKKS